MRASLAVKDISLPGYGDAVPGDQAIHLSAKMLEWRGSDYAGFRRLLEPGSDCHPDLALLRSTAEAHRKGASGKPIRDFVLLGTGGSSLGSESLLRALRPQQQEPRFHFLDNNDPTWFHWATSHLNPEETLFFVVSKSGKTPETIAQFLALSGWCRKALGGEGWKKHFLFCTDPKKGDMRELVDRERLTALPLPSAVGGRFSVLTPVGLFPAAFAGLRLDDFLQGAASIAAWESKPWSQNPCAQLARSLALGARERPITVLMPYSSQLGAFSRWFCQLWAESLGKNGHGLTPYPAVGTTDQHSQVQLYMEGPRDKSVVFVNLKGPTETIPLPALQEAEGLPAFQELKGRSMWDLFQAEFRATRDAFTAKGIPNCTLEIDTLDAYSLGALYFFWEWATAIAGAVLEVNPFDQPGVEAAKVLTKKYLGVLP